MILVMIKVNIHEAKAKLSEYLEAVGRGERVVICKRNEPIAELRAVEKKRTEPRPMGLGKGTAKILPSFWDPMPDDFLDALEGNDPRDPLRHPPPIEAKPARRKHRA
jgi:prevent-host-death family protein